MPRVSIGLPVYNGEDFLEEAVESLLKQSFKDFELIIADNGSMDSTPEICRALAAKDQRIVWMPSEANRGAAWNFNRVFFKSQGEFFKWSAADDFCEPEFLQKCVDALDKSPHAVLCHCKTRKIDFSGKKIGEYKIDNEMEVDSPDVQMRFRTQVLTNHSCVHVFGLFRRSILAKTPLIGAFVASDRVLLAEMSLYGPTCVIPEMFFARRHHGKTSMHLAAHTERTAWFDPSLSDRIVMPSWRVAGELTLAIHRAPISPGKKLKCLLHVLRYCKYRRAHLKNDLVLGWKRRLSRIKMS